MATAARRAAHRSVKKSAVHVESHRSQPRAMHHQTNPRRRFPLILLIAGWLVVVVAGMGIAVRYETMPGLSAIPPAHAPDARGSQSTLLVFAHPQCPCTRATLEQLDRIAARVGDLVKIQVHVYSAPSAGDAWTHSAIWERAARIPGVEVRADVEGHKARSLGVSTSGEALLFGPDGWLVYHGGITSARGHVGDNVGTGTIVAAVRGQPVTTTSAPVFGCSLFELGTREE
jgi:hypothetical protein